MAEFFTVDQIQHEAVQPETLEVTLEENEKLKNKGGATLDEILERKCPDGKRIYFRIIISAYEIEDL